MSFQDNCLKISLNEKNFKNKAFEEFVSKGYMLENKWMTQKHKQEHLFL